MLERRDGLYSNTPETDYYLDVEKASCIGTGGDPTSQLEPNVRYALCTWHELTDSPSVIVIRGPKGFFEQPLF